MKNGIQFSTNYRRGPIQSRIPTGFYPDSVPIPKQDPRPDQDPT